ncbi:testis-expressed protein 9-like [Ornithodoros turicata]|uniref:testis-expressed protein 9-like n=1 Tax=Ornithodoros turicata TaxID=34597 RepID=UPI0031399777
MSDTAYSKTSETSEDPEKGAHEVSKRKHSLLLGKSNKVIAELTEKNQQLEKQKLDLLTLIKKQMKLIDILKKQKIHLESTRIIQFTEEELTKLFAIEQNDPV